MLNILCVVYSASLMYITASYCRIVRRPFLFLLTAQPLHSFAAPSLAIVGDGHNVHLHHGIFRPAPTLPQSNQWTLLRINDSLLSHRHQGGAGDDAGECEFYEDLL